MIRIDPSIKLDFKDVMIKPCDSSLASRNDVNLHCEYGNFPWAKQIFTTVPIIAANMDGVGTMEMAKAFAQGEIPHGPTVALRKHYDADSLVEWFEKSPNHAKQSWYTLGTSNTDIAKFQDVMTRCKNNPPNKICLDVANGYTDAVLETVSYLRKCVEHRAIIMVGNVVTPERVTKLIEHGADVVKIGIGSGSVCLTRKMTGIGYPQFSAVLECAEAARNAGGYICSDGGCTIPADICKAFGAGANFVMLGGMLSGTGQSEEEIFHDEDGNPYIEFYGSSSEEALHKYSSPTNRRYRASEGKKVRIPYKGDVHDILNEIYGGLRSTCTYTNHDTIQTLIGNCDFIKVTAQLNNVYGAG